MSEAFFSLLFAIPIFVLMIVLIVVSIKGMNQNVAGMLNGHQIQILTGYGYARLVVDGNTVDEINSHYMYTAKLQGKVEDFDIVVNIGTGFCRRRLTTFINGIKQDMLSN